MKRINNIIPEFDKLAPIFFLMLLNLVAYANYGIYKDEVDITFSSAFIYFMSIAYVYFVVTPKFTLKDLLSFSFIMIFIALIIDTSLQYNILGILFILVYYKNKQKLIISLFKILIGLGLQYLIMFTVLNYITDDMVVYTLIYFPFSILIYKGGNLCLKNFGSQKE